MGKIITMTPFYKTFYYSVLLFAFTLPLSRAAISFFIIWFVILFIARRDYSGAWEKIKSNRVFHAMGAFIGILALSFLWSEDTSEALNQIRLYGYWIIIPILALYLKKEWLPNIITAFLGGMFVSEVLAYGIYFEWWSINDRSSDYPSPFMFHIHYSIFLAFTAIILLSRILSNRYTWYAKAPMVIFFLTSSGNLMFSTGRTGQLALLIAMAVAVVLHYRLTIKSFLIFTLLSTTLFVGAYSTVDLFQKRFDQAVSDLKTFQEGSFNSSWGLRAAFWIVTYDILREHPLLGAGIGDYYSAAATAIQTNDRGFNEATRTWCTEHHFHNQYLMILAQSGIIGFGMMIWLLIELFRLKISDPELKEFSVLGLTVFLVSCIAEPLWIVQFPIALFIFIVAISVAAKQDNESRI